MSKIPEYILCKDADLARQVLEKIEPFIGQMPTNYCKASFGSYYTAYDLLSDMYPMIINTNEGDYLSFVEQDSCPITNFTKAEDFLNNNYMTEKTWENLQERDILIDEQDRERVVLQVCRNLVCLNYVSNEPARDTVFSKDELRGIGYKIKGASEDKPSIDDALKSLKLLQDTDFCSAAAFTTVRVVYEMLKKLK